MAEVNREYLRETTYKLYKLKKHMDTLISRKRITESTYEGILNLLNDIKVCTNRYIKEQPNDEFINAKFWICIYKINEKLKHYIIAFEETTKFAKSKNMLLTSEARFEAYRKLNSIITSYMKDEDEKKLIISLEKVLNKKINLADYPLKYFDDEMNEIIACNGLEILAYTEWLKKQ